jgi:hypothetical protein
MHSVRIVLWVGLDRRDLATAAEDVIGCRCRAASYDRAMTAEVVALRAWCDVDLPEEDRAAPGGFAHAGARLGWSVVPPKRRVPVPAALIPACTSSRSSPMARRPRLHLGIAAMTTTLARRTRWTRRTT